MVWAGRAVLDAPCTNRARIEGQAVAPAPPAASTPATPMKISQEGDRRALLVSEGGASNGTRCAGAGWAKALFPESSVVGPAGVPACVRPGARRPPEIGMRLS